MRGRVSLVVGCGGVVLATHGGCVVAPAMTKNRHAGNGGEQSPGGTSGQAGNVSLGGTNPGAGSGGKGGSSGKGGSARGGKGGSHTSHAGSGGGTTTAAVGGGSDLDGAGGETAGAASGEAGAENTAGASPSSGGTAGVATGGTAGANLGGMSGRGGNNSGGIAGYNDVEEPFDGPCPSSVVSGWVTVAGLGFDPATAGAPGPEVVVTDAATLQSYATSPDPYVIRISGTIAVPTLDVSSNKVIEGDDALATLQGGIRILGTSTDPSGMVSNIVIKNLTIDASTSTTSSSPDENDGIKIAYAHHVWIDHVDVKDAPGDNLNVMSGSDYITMSWTKIHYVNGSRRTGARIGHSDANAAEDTGRLKVTLHHNWWMDSLDQRMPRVRFGDVHVFDNYYSNRNTEYLDNTYCIAAGYESRLLVENNFFDESYNPHVFFSFVGGVASYTEPTAEMVANGNTYVGVSDLPGGKLFGQGPSFVPPYSITLEPADDVLRNTIRHCAGVE